MREREVAGLCPVAASALAWVVVIVHALVVRTAIVIVASRPMQGGVIVGTGLSYGGQQRRGCGWMGAPSVGCGGGDVPVVGVFVVSGQPSGFVVGLGHGGKHRGAAAASEGLAFVGVNSGGGGPIGTF